ncbi:MAG: SDR family NAD(P)-dependent oxidoreductase [Saccharofermentanales bacterium]
MKALITGASSGIGRDMALDLSRRGYDLILVARRMDRLEKLKSGLSTDVQLIGLDLSVESSCVALYEMVKSQEIDILINNAGYGIFGDFIDVDLDQELNMIDLNIKAVHILSKLFLKDFIARDSGYILNVASVAAFLPGPLFAGYYATKAYVLRLSEAIYEELRQSGSKVHISVLCPGPVRTEFDHVAHIDQGRMGLDSGFVAKYAIDRMFRGKMVIVPGVAIKLARFFAKVTPEKILLRGAFLAQKSKIRGGNGVNGDGSCNQ